MSRVATSKRSNKGRTIKPGKPSAKWTRADEDAVTRAEVEFYRALSEYRGMVTAADPASKELRKARTDYLRCEHKYNEACEAWSNWVDEFERLDIR